jgi:hypothetical protein
MYTVRQLSKLAGVTRRTLHYYDQIGLLAPSQVAERRHMDHFWTPDDEQLLALSESYITDLRFRANFDELDPKLAEFIRDAVAAYLNQP